MRYSVIVLLIGTVALCAGQANAQNGHRDEIIIESFSWGIAPGQTVHLSVIVYANRPLSTNDPVISRIQLLDTEGEVVAQSDQIRVEPGKIRLWDAPYEQIGGVREPGTGRLQLRARILFERGSSDLYNPFVTVDFVESTTGATSGPSIFLTLTSGKHI
jgi:hypothetical protein